MISVHGTEPLAFVLFTPCTYSAVRQELLASSCSSLYTSVCPHVLSSALLPLDGLPRFWIFVAKVQIGLKSDKNVGAFCMRAVKELSSSKRV